MHLSAVLLWSLNCLLPAFYAEASTTIKTIGIIGGDVPGLGAANRVSQSPNHKVIVLERGNEPVPLQHRVRNNGNTHDMDMISSRISIGRDMEWKTDGRIYCKHIMWNFYPWMSMEACTESHM